METSNGVGKSAFFEAIVRSLPIRNGDFYYCVKDFAWNCGVRSLPIRNGDPVEIKENENISIDHP